MTSWLSQALSLLAQLYVSCVNIPRATLYVSALTHELNWNRLSAPELNRSSSHASKPTAKWHSRTVFTWLSEHSDFLRSPEAAHLSGMDQHAEVRG